MYFNYDKCLLLLYFSFIYILLFHILKRNKESLIILQNTIKNRQHMETIQLITIKHGCVGIW